MFLARRYFCDFGDIDKCIYNKYRYHIIFNNTFFAAEMSI